MVLEREGTDFQDHSLKKYVKNSLRSGNLRLPQKGELAPVD